MEFLLCEKFRSSVKQCLVDRISDPCKSLRLNQGKDTVMHSIILLIVPKLLSD